MNHSVSGGPALPLTISAPISVETLPLIVIPPTADTITTQWFSGNKDWIENMLRKHGAILFRDFGLHSSAQLKEIGALLSNQWMDYVDRATKRSEVDGPVKTGTDTPAQFETPLHCESSFASSWPMRLFFLCLTPARVDGRTPIANVRRVYERMDPRLRQRFEEKGVLYVRNFGAGPGMDWREVFQVKDKAELKAYCSEADIEIDWLSEGRLRTRQVRPAVVKHPQTGQAVWFNHTLALHLSALEPNLRETILRQYGEEGLPHNVYFGDGTPLTQAEIQHIHACHRMETIRFDWQKGDLLLVDNMHVAHARESFKGERKVVVAVADPNSWQNLGLSLAILKPGGQTAQPRYSQQASHATPAQTGEKPALTQSDIQAGLIKIMMEVLEIDSMGPDDDFLDVGGDSISAAQIISRVQEALGLELEMDLIFDVGTPAGMATALSQ